MAAARVLTVTVVGRHDPVTAVHDALHLLGFDEVMLSVLPARSSRWLRLGLPAQIAALGVPVRTVISVSHDTNHLPAA